MKLTLDIPDVALIKVVDNPDEYLGPLLIVIGAEILKQIRDASIKN